MPRFSLGATRKDKIRNEHIRGTLKVDRMPASHVKLRDDDYVGINMLETQLPEKRRLGRPERRYLGVVKEDM